MKAWLKRQATRVCVALCAGAAFACSPMLEIGTQLEGDGGVRPEDSIAVEFAVRADSIEIELDNVGESPIDVLWQKASIVDAQGNAWNVMHSGGRSFVAARDQSGEDVSRVPPHSTMREIVVPRQSVAVEEGWVIQPFVAVECGPVRCTGQEQLVGKKVRLTMAMVIRGTERVFDWTFRITETLVTTRRERYRRRYLKDPE